MRRHSTEERREVSIDSTRTAPEGPVSDKVSDAVARLYLDKYGKGPLHTETYVNGDVVTTLMRDVFTPVETLLKQAGRGNAVVATRIEWQAVTDEMLCAAVAQATGREVLAAISGFDIERDLATGVFLLAPE